MIFSGYNYRSIFEQTGLSFDLNISINNLFGSGAFGFSGENNQIKFKFENGKIFDFENRYVYSYLPNQEVNISGDLENTNYSYYINKTPIAFNGVKNNFKIDKFFYESSECVLNSTLKLNAAVPPSFYFEFPKSYNVENPYITGKIINTTPNLAFKIFTGSISPIEAFTINSIDNTISGLQSGNIFINSYNEVGTYNLNLNLYTNFGFITKNFIISGFYSLKDLVTLSLTSDKIISGERESFNSLYGSLDYSYQQLSGTTIVNEFNNLPLSIKFEYYSGKTGLFTGDILGSGYGYNLISSGIIDNGQVDLIFTGLAAISGVNYTGGLYTGHQPATGIATVIATGIYDYNIIYPGIGFFTGIAVTKKSLDYFVQYFTGGINVPFVNPNTPGTGALTGYNTTWLTGYFETDNIIFSGTVTGANYLYGVGLTSGTFSGLLSGEISQYLSTGFATLLSNKIKIFKVATGEFDVPVKSGKFKVDYSGLIFNKDNLYGSYHNRNDLGLYDNTRKNWNQATIDAHPGLLSGLSFPLIERRGLLIFDSGNPNDFTTNPIIYNIENGQINKIVTYPEQNLSFIVGRCEYINKNTGRWGGFLLTGNNFDLTDWNPSIKYDGEPIDAYINDIFLTGDDVYIGGKFTNVNLGDGYNGLATIKVDNNYLINPMLPVKNFIFTDWRVLQTNISDYNVKITKIANLNDKLYIFGSFDNFLNGIYTNKSLWGAQRIISGPVSSRSSIVNYYDSLLILDPITQKNIPDPYDLYWLDYIGASGFNGLNFDKRQDRVAGYLQAPYSYTLVPYVNNILKIAENKNYVIGNFKKIGLTKRNNLAVYNESGDLLPYNPNFRNSNFFFSNDSNNASIKLAFESGDNLFLIGQFGNINALHDRGLSANSTDGGLYNLMKLINPFTVDRTFLPSRFALSGVFGSHFSTGLDMDFYEDNIYSVGAFNYIIEKTGFIDDPFTWIPRKNCAIFNQGGELLSGNYEFDNFVKTIYITGSTGYFGGAFTEVTTNSTPLTSRSGFAAIDLITHEILPISGHFDGIINQIGHYTGDHILVVGEFTNLRMDNITTAVNGMTFFDTSPAPLSNINRITNRTTSQSSNNNFQGFTKFIDENDDIAGFYLYGNLSSTIDINNITTTTLGVPSYNNAIIQLNKTGGLITGFRPIVVYNNTFSDYAGTIYSAYAISGTVIVGGNFTKINNTGSKKLAMLKSGIGTLITPNYTGFSILGLGPTFPYETIPSTIFDIKPYNDSLISVGDFTKHDKNKMGAFGKLAGRFLYHDISGTKIYNSLKFNFTSMMGATQNILQSFPIYKIKNYKDSIFLCGTYSLYPTLDLDTFSIISLDSNNSTTGYLIPDNTFNKNAPSFSSMPTCFVTGKSGIYIGGGSLNPRNNNYYNVPRSGFLLIDYNGNLLPFHTELFGTVNSLLITGEDLGQTPTLFVGGNFNMVGGNIECNNVIEVLGGTINSTTVCAYQRIAKDIVKLRLNYQATGNHLNSLDFSSFVDLIFTPPTFDSFVDPTYKINKLYVDKDTLYIGNAVPRNYTSYQSITALNSTNGKIITTNNIANFFVNNLPNSAPYSRIIHKIDKINDVFLINGTFVYPKNNKSIFNFLGIKTNGEISNFSNELLDQFSNGLSQVDSFHVGKDNRIYLKRNGAYSDYRENLPSCILLDTGSNTFKQTNWKAQYINGTSFIYQNKKTNNIFFLGDFDSVGRYRAGICEINDRGEINLDFNPNIYFNKSYVSGHVKDIVQFNQTGIAIVGDFATSPTGPPKFFTIINTIDGTTNDFNLNFSHPPQSLYKKDNNIYIGGNFINITGDKTHQYFSNFIGLSTGNMNLIKNNISFVANTSDITGSKNININSINNFNNKFLVGGNFKNLNPYIVISGSGAFTTGILSGMLNLNGSGKLILDNSSGIFRGYLSASGIDPNPFYNFSYVTNQNTIVNSVLVRDATAVANSNYVEFTGKKLFVETGSGIITGIETLVKETGLWYVTGKFTGILSGSVYLDDYKYYLGTIATGLLLGSGYATTNISPDPFLSNEYLTGTIQISPKYVIDTYNELISSGTHFYASSSLFKVTGIEVSNSKIITGYYSGQAGGAILQTTSNGTVLSPQIQFITSGNYQSVTGAFGITNVFEPRVYATGIFSFSTGNIQVTGYIRNVPQYAKDFTGVFQISTGLFSTDEYVLLSIYNNIYTGNLTYNINDSLSIKIDYTSYADYNPLVGKLTLSGTGIYNTGYTVYTTLISGI